MKRGFFLLILLGGVFFGFGLPGCGDGQFGLLTIVPEGPTIVRKDDTLQFTANRTDVTWSIQGAAKGTIAADGLYTPPGAIPVDSPRVTVMATSDDGQVATGLVDLRTGSSLAFGAPQPVNETAIPNGTSLINLLIKLVGGDRISVRLGSVHVDSTWIGLNGAVQNVFFSQSLDLGGFLPEVNIGQDLVNNQVPTNIETDSLENPGILLTSQTSGGDPTQVMFLGSDDQGATFNAAVFLSPSSERQDSGVARLDQLDRIHAVLREENSSVIGTPEDVFYVRSEDGGATWSAPQPVSDTADGAGEENVFAPHLAVDPQGTQVYVCWLDGDSREVLFSLSTDGGAAFSAPMPLTDAGGAGDCRVAVGPSGEVYVVYSEDTAGSGEQDVFLKKSTDGGNNFSSAIPVSLDPTHVLGSPLAYLSVDGLGRIDVVWGADLNDSGSVNDIMYSRSLNGGDTFSDDIPVFSGADNDFIFPTGLRHDPTGRLYLQFVVASAPTDISNHDVFMLIAE